MIKKTTTNNKPSSSNNLSSDNSNSPSSSSSSWDCEFWWFWLLEDKKCFFDLVYLSINLTIRREIDIKIMISQTHTTSLIPYDTSLIVLFLSIYFLFFFKPSPLWKISPLPPLEKLLCFPRHLLCDRSRKIWVEYPLVHVLLLLS